MTERLIEEFLLKGSTVVAAGDAARIDGGHPASRWVGVTGGNQLREQGFYWVRVCAYDGIPSDWNIARWTGDAWYFTWIDRPVAEWEMFEIDERRVVREAP